MTLESYNPKPYWEERLRRNFNLRGVGHSGFNAAYNEWLYRRKVHVIEKIFQNIDLAEKEVFDIGCGTGFFVQWYLRRGARISGIDITEVSIKELSTRFNGMFRTQDISSVEYRPSNAFDIVNMWDVIYHIVDDDAYERALDNIAASLKVGGSFIFSDWLGKQGDGKTAAHVKGRCMATHQNALSKRGLRWVATYPLYNFLDVGHFGPLDNFLGRAYYLFDYFQRRPAPDNLSVGVWSRSF